MTSRFADGTGDLWWIALERAVAASDRLETTIGTTTYSFALASDKSREKAFATLYRALRALPDQEEISAVVEQMAQRAGVATGSICRDLCMSWQQVADLATDPLVTIGAHSDTHLMLAKAPCDEARADIARNLARMEAELGVRPQHFCYPVGDCTSAGPRDFRIAEEFGFKTALTTRRGALYPEHRDHLTALPRISANGKYQTLRYTETLIVRCSDGFGRFLAKLGVAQGRFFMTITSIGGTPMIASLHAMAGLELVAPAQAGAVLPLRIHDHALAAGSDKRLDTAVAACRSAIEGYAR